MGGHTMREGLTEERPHCPPPRLCAGAGRVSTWTAIGFNAAGQRALYQPDSVCARLAEARL